MLLNCEAVHIFLQKLLSFIHLSIKKLSLFTFIIKARSKKIIQHRFKEEVSMNNYDPYDPNQNQSYGEMCIRERYQNSVLSGAFESRKIKNAGFSAAR